MAETLTAHSFRSLLDLGPLLDFWNHTVARWDENWRLLNESIQSQADLAPWLKEPIEDLSILKSHEDLIRSLMSVVFPSASMDSEALAAGIPFSMNHFYASPLYRDLFLTNGSSLAAHGLEGDQKAAFNRARTIKCYLLILRQCYNIRKDMDYPVVRTVIDPATGLDRYYKMFADLKFVRVRPIGGLPALGDAELASVLDHLTEPEVMSRFLPPERFEFHGFSIIRGVDVTESEVLNGLEQDLIGEGSVLSNDGFNRLQMRLRTLFRRPQLVSGLSAMRDNQVLLLNTGCQMTHNCIFNSSRHVGKDEFAGSVFHRAVEQGRVLLVRDVGDYPSKTRVEEDIINAGLRSMLVVPLFSQGELIGTLDMCSPEPGDLGPRDAYLAEQIAPLFSMAIRTALQELDNQIDRIIKQRCTAVHPAVEWRFRRSVLEHLERQHKGEASELEPIIFRNVFPIYGATDIRGSSEKRSAAIQSDIFDHLALALDVVKIACEARPLAVLEEIGFRITSHLERVDTGLSTGDEQLIMDFIRREVDPLLSTLRKYSSATEAAVTAYNEAIDPNAGTVYRKRKDFEDSIALFNKRVAAYLDQEQAEAQDVFPHYFEKHQTDGMEYVMYVGQSLLEQGGYNPLYLRGLRLWQIMLACGIAWHAVDLQSELKVPLEATHLILAHHTPLSIRFRFDEKRFDVDGAYDVGHEIIRSRLDKAMIKGRDERLTQPGKVAIVYSNPESAQEMMRYVTFLQKRDYLKGQVEWLDLADLQGVQGLRALRVEVNVASDALREKARILAG